MVEICLNSFAINELMLVFAVKITDHLHDSVMIWSQFLVPKQRKSNRKKSVRGDNRAFPFLIFNYLNETEKTKNERFLRSTLFYRH